jgi:hypothetical protein
LKAVFATGFTCLLVGGFAAEADPVTAIVLGTIGIIVSAVSGVMIHREDVRREIWGA